MTRQWLNGAGLATFVLGLTLAPTLDAAAQERPRASIEGSWTGDFGAGQWTFRFERVNGTWSGSYTYPQYQGRNPVINLSASDTAARFSLKAKTYVNFNVKLDPSRSSLSGTVKFEHGVTPNSPPVVLPVTFKRVA